MKVSLETCLNIAWAETSYDGGPLLFAIMVEASPYMSEEGRMLRSMQMPLSLPNVWRIATQTAVGAAAGGDGMPRSEADMAKAARYMFVCARRNQEFGTANNPWPDQFDADPDLHGARLSHRRPMAE